MELVLKRQKHNEDATIGHLYIEDKMFCHILEDQPQFGPKVPDETRIPAGRYKIELRIEGGMYERYKRVPFYQDFFQGHLWLQDVPDFEWIYIHPGNTDDHTSGCLLPGISWSPTPRWRVESSRVAYKKLYLTIIESVLQGDCWITVEDEPGFVAAVPEEDNPDDGRQFTY